jgi:hypothetical protein
MTDQEWAEAKFNEITNRFPSKEVIVRALLDAIQYGRRSSVEHCACIVFDGEAV